MRFERVDALEQPVDLGPALHRVTPLRQQAQQLRPERRAGKRKAVWLGREQYPLDRVRGVLASCPEQQRVPVRRLEGGPDADAIGAESPAGVAPDHGAIERVVAEGVRQRLDGRGAVRARERSDRPIARRLTRASPRGGGSGLSGALDGLHAAQG